MLNDLIFLFYLCILGKRNSEVYLAHLFSSEWETDYNQEICWREQSMHIFNLVWSYLIIFEISHCSLSLGIYQSNKQVCRGEWEGLLQTPALMVPPYYLLNRGWCFHVNIKYVSSWIVIIRGKCFLWSLRY